MNNKGELTTQQLVILIVLIASFAVILFLLWRLNLGETSDKEICHNSVVLRSQSKIIGSLDCRTNYVCISGGEDCSAFTQTIKTNAKTEEEISKAIKQEIDDCWWMFGEEKVDYIGYSWKLDIIVGNQCAICSIIKFDDKIQEEFPEINFEGEKILTAEKYSIITGMTGENDFISAQIIKSDEVVSKLDCDEFITKA
ncbi:MAG: hypothetical protein Q8O84_05215 [Nanoarchaeota archaeon]|nr:hypothetical protein [Nanoarchaeota archaeon]